MRPLTFVIGILSALCLSSAVDAAHAAAKVPVVLKADSAAVSHNAVKSATYGSVPLRFEQNVGQSDGRVKFLTHSAGSTLFLTGTDAVLCLTKMRTDSAHFASLSANSPRPTPQAGIMSVVRMRAVGANDHATVTGLSELPGKANYFIGNDKSKWHSNVAMYKRVEYYDLYKHIDLAYYGANGHVEYDFIIKPGGDPRTIKLAFSGARSMHIASTGDLVLSTGSGDVRWRKPVVYQDRGGRRTELAGNYVALGRGKVRFAVAKYDASLPLVIDPVLVYSTFVGGTDADYAYAVAADSAGCAYTTGLTASIDYPVSSGAYEGEQNGESGTWDAFVTKLNASGSDIVYSTYIGGSDDDYGNAIAVDAKGQAYVAGSEDSSDFPVTAGAFQTTDGGGYDGFVTVLNATGSALVYSTQLGGSDDDSANAIALDASDNAYVVGTTSSSDFPVTGGTLQSTFGGTSDAFVVKLNSTGSAAYYSTYLGGSRTDDGYGVAIDSSGNAYVTGDTYSLDFPTTTGAFQTVAGGYIGGFVTKLNPGGTALVYSTYLSGKSFDNVFAIAVDGSGSAYVVGNTESSNFPVTTGAYQTVSAGSYDAFATKFNAAGSGLVYSTLFGGSDSDVPYAVAVDSSGNAYIGGATGSTNFPVTSGAYQPSFAGPVNGVNGFLTALNATGTALVYSTFLGPVVDSTDTGLALDSNGNVYVAAATTSTTYSTSENAYQPAYEGGDSDTVVMKFSLTKPLNILWTHAPDNGFSLWSLTGTTPTDQAYGPYTGYKAIAVATGPDGVAHIILDRTADHQFCLWAVNPDFTFTSTAYGPYSGWQATDLTVTPDNHVHVLLSNNTGTISLWDMASPTSIVSNPTYNPGSGWSATHLAEGPDGDVHILLNHASDNEAAIWDIASPTSMTYSGFGPYAGWKALGLAVSANNHTHVLWTHPADNEASIWDMTSFTQLTNPTYGPYAGWAAQAIATTPDGDVHVQWVGPNNTYSIWDMASLTAITNPVYGPYSGWSALTMGNH